MTVGFAMRRGHQRISLEKRDAFLVALREGLSIAAAASAAGISQGGTYGLKRRDPEVAAEMGTRRTPHKIGDAERRVFLEALARGETRGSAARLSGVTSSAWDCLALRDLEFAAAKRTALGSRGYMRHQLRSKDCALCGVLVAKGRAYCSAPCRSRGRTLLMKYEIEPREFRALWESQGRRCASCRCEVSIVPVGGDHTKGVMDHDHGSGKSRSILCSNCNAALGFARENTETLFGLSVYVARHSFDLRDLCSAAA